MVQGSDREQRAITAAMILTLLKMNACSARQAATYLGVSPTTISHWQAASSAEGKSIGTPTDDQLRKLVGLLRAMYERNQFAMMDFVTSRFARPREQALALKALTPLVEQTLSYLQKQQAEFDSLRATLLGLHEELGADSGERLIGPIFASYGAAWPSPEELAALEAETADPGLSLADIDISDEEVEKLKAEYVAYTQQVQDRIRAMLLRKVKRQQAQKPVAE